MTVAIVTIRVVAKRCRSPFADTWGRVCGPEILTSLVRLPWSTFSGAVYSVAPLCFFTGPTRSPRCSCVCETVFGASSSIASVTVFVIVSWRRSPSFEVLMRVVVVVTLRTAFAFEPRLPLDVRRSMAKATTKCDILSIPISPQKITIGLSASITFKIMN